MKAHLTKEPAAALVWGVEKNSDSYVRLALLCRRYGLALRPVEAGETGCTVGQLLGVEKKGRTPAPLPAADLPAALVMSGLGNRLDSFVDQLKAQGVAIPLKAIVTPTNRGWSFGALLAELCREREALAAQQAKQEEKA